MDELRDPKLVAAEVRAGDCGNAIVAAGLEADTVVVNHTENYDYEELDAMMNAIYSNEELHAVGAEKEGIGEVR